jgi:hypothetical protein
MALLPLSVGTLGAEKADLGVESPPNLEDGERIVPVQSILRRGGVAP